MLLSVASDLPVSDVEANLSVRLSTHTTGEPYFGASGTNRFDAPGCRSGHPEYRACYFGHALDVAIAESLLHDAVATDGTFRIAGSRLQSNYVHRFEGDTLRLLELAGALLKRLDGHADLAGTADYPITQLWAHAVYQNPQKFDGFIYMSRHLNTGRAVVLFDRAASKLRAIAPPTRLCDFPGFAVAADAFGIIPA